METIIYKGKKYLVEEVSGYYDPYMKNYPELVEAKNEQDFFDRYIELEPDFVDLFKNEINPITE